MQLKDGPSILERLIEPLSRSLTPDSARTLVYMRVDDAVQARVSELAAKCNEGQLSETERAEYETYVHAGNLVAILQAKARLLLRNQTAA